MIYPFKLSLSFSFSFCLLAQFKFNIHLETEEEYILELDFIISIRFWLYIFFIQPKSCIS